MAPAAAHARRRAGARARERDGRAGAGRDRRLRRHARGAARARSWASPAWTATASASWPRRSQASGRSRPATSASSASRSRASRSRSARSSGLRYVTDDRLDEGTVGADVGGDEHRAQADRQAAVLGARPHPQRRDPCEKARELIARFDIRTPGPETRVGALSGGNIQKVVLARELSFDPKVVVYSKPTYGLDVKTTRSVRQTIREQAGRGRDFDRHLHRSRRAARPLRPDRRPVARARRGRRRERAGARSARSAS